ncbi:phenylalanine--tRNA ligase subunit beta [Waterburya agarophytonicola K14]|uniref:Phenylalanine--tRNA ligase beta subunit n=1 Tax=Waterburya agarophytonicola KI4 TaxID=2874699 RepID=A0A964FDV9_9CYAN|nr:phenylalanine--tRNA ligase subunit beta [Waterburya agarophytonicola]MCC0176050.1 phenylalanine--tRNA ligase subunit beta [Waterburya agarophytonicola KI4]
MRVSLNWLKEFVDIHMSPEELGRVLTIAGFELEELIDLRKNADGVVVGKVVERSQHPNADKLSVCKVDIGANEPLNIVCGASNVRADIFVPVATVGTYLPAIDLKLKPTKLRGEPSAGMICSLTELGLEKDSDGIHIFEENNIKPGDDVRPLLGLDDVILDLATTANRADALSMVGIAREVAALTGAKVRLPEVKSQDIAADSSLNVDVKETDACMAYIGTVIEGVKVEPSPDWLKWRLEAAGTRPINNVVDITNYVLLEWGQPLHAFDREKLQEVAGNNNLTLGVRFAKEGEKLKTLDEQERELTTQNLLITANDKPVALGGVMGGEETEVDDNTNNIVLEAALFDPVAIRRSSRAQGMRSEASTRYERGVNQVELESAGKRAIALLQKLAGGTPKAQSIADSRIDFSSLPAIELRLSRINHLLGAVNKANGIGYIEAGDVESILGALGCNLELVAGKDNTWLVKVPPYRYRDLEREIDLIEEVARLYGYDRFCDTLPAKTESGQLSPEYAIKNKLRAVLRGVGLTEVVQYSLVKPTGIEVTLDNPLFAEYSALRGELFSGLLDSFAYNLAQGNGALNAFEIERVFWQEGEELKEKDSLAGIMGGNITSEGLWVNGGKGTPMSWYDAKGVLENIFSNLGISVEYRPENIQDRLHPGRTAALWLQGRNLGLFGQIHPQLAQERDLPNEVYLFELDFSLLLTVLNRDSITTPKFKTYSTYPGSARDLAFFAPLDISVTAIEKVMNKTGGKLLQKVEVFDEYKGKNVPEGQRSLAFNLVYQASDRTLTDKDVDPVHQKVRDTLVKKFYVTLRS